MATPPTHLAARTARRVPGTSAVPGRARPSATVYSGDRHAVVDQALALDQDRQTRGAHAGRGRRPPRRPGRWPRRCCRTAAPRRAAGARIDDQHQRRRSRRWRCVPGTASQQDRLRTGCAAARSSRRNAASNSSGGRKHEEQDRRIELRQADDVGLLDGQAAEHQRHGVRELEPPGEHAEQRRAEEHRGEDVDGRLDGLKPIEQIGPAVTGSPLSREKNSRDHSSAASAGGMRRRK